MKLISIKPSVQQSKKFMAVFETDTKTKTVHFGAKGMDDYTITKDKEQRDRYRQRHRNDRINVPDTPGSLSFYILWGESTNMKTNVSFFKKKFNV